MPGSGSLEERLDAMCGAGAIDELASQVRLSGKIKGERKRLLTAAFVIRAVLLMTLMPAAPYCEVMAALAGGLPLVPWARQWHRPGPDVLPGWRSAIGPDPLEELQYRVLRTVCAEHREHDWRGGADRGPDGWVGGRDPGAGAGHRREPRGVRVLRHAG